MADDGYVQLDSDGKVILNSEGYQSLACSSQVLCGDCDKDIECTFAGVNLAWAGCAPCAGQPDFARYWELVGASVLEGTFRLTRQGSCIWKYWEDYSTIISRIWSATPCASGAPGDDPDNPLPAYVDSTKLLIFLAPIPATSVMSLNAELTFDPGSVFSNLSAGTLFQSTFPAASFDCNGFTVTNKTDDPDNNFLVDCSANPPNFRGDPGMGDSEAFASGGTADLIGVT